MVSTVRLSKNAGLLSVSKDGDLPLKIAVEFWQNDKFSLPAFFLIPLWAFANCHTGKSFITCHNTKLYIFNNSSDLNAGHVIALYLLMEMHHFQHS